MNKVTDDELQEIQKLRDGLVELVTIMGELRLNEFIARDHLETVQQQISVQEQSFLEFREKERVLFERLTEKYGPHIDFKTGEIRD